ncbi:Uncharacterised protein [Mycobacteroides abscessus subsp. abscessus]|nr:Uncharacterised protein [Mycobacteroides abscessus subsp. abscessus]
MIDGHAHDGVEECVRARLVGAFAGPDGPGVSPAECFTQWHFGALDQNRVLARFAVVLDQ